MPFTDARGRTISLHHPPQRIVSLVPSQTELLANLGLESEVVGITRFCIHPEDWKGRKQIVGGTKNVNLRRVRDLAPDLILANLEENTREDVEALDEIAPVYVTDVLDVQSALDMIRTVGELVCRKTDAADLAEHIEASFSRLSMSVPLRAAYLIWRDPYMTVGNDTFIHDIMRRTGLANVFGHHQRYPALTPEELAAASPDVVLLSTEPYPFQEKHLPEIQALLPDARLHLVDGELFSWYGSRMLETPAYLTELRQRIQSEPAPLSTRPDAAHL